MFWTDEGGYGVRPKVGRANMDGTESIVLVNNIDHPEAITIDVETKVYYSLTLLLKVPYLLPTIYLFVSCNASFRHIIIVKVLE